MANTKEKFRKLLNSVKTNFKKTNSEEKQMIYDMVNYILQSNKKTKYALKQAIDYYETITEKSIDDDVKNRIADKGIKLYLIGKRKYNTGEKYAWYFAILFVSLCLVKKQTEAHEIEHLFQSFIYEFEKASEGNLWDKTLQMLSKIVSPDVAKKSNLISTILGFFVK